MQPAAQWIRAHRQDLAWALGFVAVGFALLGRTLFGDEALFARDVLHYYWPMRDAVAKAFAEGRLPQWDAGSMAGLPLLANIHAAVFYPPNLLHQVLSFPRAYALLIYLHLVAGAVGLYAFLRARGLQSLAAGTGGLAWFLCGPLLSLVNAGPLVAGAAWIPWVLFVLARPFRWATRTLWLAALIALQALCGDPQSVVYSGLAAAAFLAFEPRRLERVATFFGGGVLAALWCGIQLAPAAWLLRESTRAEGAVSSGRFEWALHPLRLIELVSPFPLGRYLEGAEFWGEFTVHGPSRQPFAYSTYLGVAVAALAFLGLRRSRRIGPGITLVLTGVFLGLAWGPFGLLEAHIPPFSFFRYPEKYVLVAGLGAALLAAEGVQALAEKRVSGRRVAILLVPLAASAGVFLWLHLGTGGAIAAFASGFEALKWRASPAAAVTALHDSFSHAILFGGLMVACVAAAWRYDKLNRLVLLVPAIVGIDLFVTTGAIVWTAPRLLFENEPPLVASMRRHAPQPGTRFIRDRVSLISETPGRDKLETLAMRRAWDVLTLKSNVGSVFGLEEASGYGAVVLQRWQEVGAHLFKRPELLGRVLGACLGISGPGSRRFDGREGWTHVDRVHPGVDLFALTPCPPRIHAVTELLSEPDFPAALHRLTEDPPDLLQTAVVEGMPAAKLAAARIQEGDRWPGHFEAKVSADGPAFVVVATSWYPGWSATLDGAPAKLVHTNGATFGISVPKGEHDLQVDFHDPGLTIGLVLTGTGLLAAIALALVGSWLRRRRPTADASDPGQSDCAQAVREASSG